MNINYIEILYYICVLLTLDTMVKTRSSSAIKGIRKQTGTLTIKRTRQNLTPKIHEVKARNIKKTVGVMVSKIENRKKSKILRVLERVVKISKKGTSELIDIDKKALKLRGCKPLEIGYFQSNNGVPYLRRESPICRKYQVQRVYDKLSGSLIGFKLIGFNKSIQYSRSIPQEVRKATLERYNCKCVLCGATERLEVDHKNGRYNAVTNKVDDFQILCKNCNDKKREKCKKCTASGRRYNVQEEISPTLYKVPFTHGDSKYTAKLGCKGCFMYDIEDFYETHDNGKKKNHKMCEYEVIVKEVSPRSKSATTGKFGRVVVRQKVSL